MKVVGTDLDQRHERTELQISVQVRPLRQASLGVTQQGHRLCLRIHGSTALVGALLERKRLLTNDVHLLRIKLFFLRKLEDLPRLIPRTKPTDLDIANPRCVVLELK